MTKRFGVGKKKSWTGIVPHKFKALTRTTGGGGGAVVTSNKEKKRRRPTTLVGGAGNGSPRAPSGRE